MFDFTDPFGIGRIRELEYTLREREAAHRGELEGERARADEGARVANYMVDIAMGQRGEIEQLRHMLDASEKARKSQGEKIISLTEQLQIARENYDALSEESKKTEAERNTIREELEALYAEHARLVEGMANNVEIAPCEEIELTKEKLAALPIVLHEGTKEARGAW